MDLRQRRGVLAVDHVDRLEEPKEHAHLNRVVRQGPLQGVLTFVGLLVPLIALHAVTWPSSPADFWRCFPLAFRSLAGPMAELLLVLFKRHHRVLGRERWLSQTIVTLASLISLSALPFMATSSLRMDLRPCAFWLMCSGVVAGLVVSFLDSVWPNICYRLGLIESKDPPSPLSGNEENSWNPYRDAEESSQKIVGHFFLVVRLVNLCVLVPLIEELFFRDYIFEKLGAGSGEDVLLPTIMAAMLWSAFNMHYKGEWVLRFLFGVVLQALVLYKPVTCGLVPSVLAQATRNLAATAIAVRYRKWHRWSV